MKKISAFLCLFGFVISLYPASDLEKQLALFDTIATSYQKSMASYSRLRFALWYQGVEDISLLKAAQDKVDSAHSEFESSKISLLTINFQAPESKISFDKFKKIEKSVYDAEIYYKGSLNPADTPSGCCGLM